MSFFNSEVFTFFVLPALIFLARICDVTLSTIRTIFITRGHKYLAPLIGLFEISIWLIAIGKTLQNLSNPFCYIAYALGFVTGNFVGILIEEKLAIGASVVQVITQKDASELIRILRCTGFGVTSIPADGSTGRVHLIYTVVKRSDLKNVVETIKKFNPKAFYSVEDIRFVSEGVFPPRKSLPKINGLTEA